jgi:hypothetical protein
MTGEFSGRHPRESGDAATCALVVGGYENRNIEYTTQNQSRWVPGFAGMTAEISGEQS